MAYKEFEIEKLGSVRIYKRRGARNVRLSIGHDGEVRVSLPAWAPYKMGLEFARRKTSWIIEQRPSRALITDGCRIGKYHRLRFSTDPEAAKITTRVSKLSIVVKLPPKLASHHPSAQASAEAAAIRALKVQSRQLIPQRLDALAQKHNLNYASLSIKQMRSRWGSCSNQRDIVINCFLIQLPWELIDYVLLHELTHTEIMAHSKLFWERLNQLTDDLPRLRREIRQFRPALMPITSN